MSNSDHALKTAPRSNIGVTSRYPELMHGVLDPSVTGIAVELTLPQNHVNAETVEPYLKSLCELVAVDCVFVALFDETREKIEWVNSVSNKYDLCNPFVLLNSQQPCCERLKSKLANKQLLEIRDTGAADTDNADFNAKLAGLNLGSMLVAGLSCNNGEGSGIAGIMVLGTMRRRSRWDMDTHLMLKLMAASYAAGYERYVLNSSAYLTV
ncbi:MAG TPA: hypothetical protein VHL14_13575 [Steroidobacteraceae bacterium]|nr:hypothetical protein [Steroidobacteraceae bacterium]